MLEEEIELEMKNEEHKKKKKNGHPILLTILIILLALNAYLIFMAYQAYNSFTSSYKEALKAVQNENGSFTGDAGILAMYQNLQSQLSKYSLESQYEEQTTNLANTVLDKTLVDVKVTSMEFTEDGMTITIASNGANIADIDQSLIQNIVLNSAKDYLTSHIGSIASNLLTGNQEALEKDIYQNYGKELIDQVNQAVKDLPAGAQQVKLSITSNNGKWKVTLK